MEILDKKQLCIGLNESAKTIHNNNREKGFWDKERNVGELLMLVTSELGEALDAHQKGRFANWEQYEEYSLYSPGLFKTHIKDSFEDEIADAIIRLLDLSAGLNIDIEKHINAKVKYNKSRERLHGKLY